MDKLFFNKKIFRISNQNITCIFGNNSHINAAFWWKNRYVYIVRHVSKSMWLCFYSCNPSTVGWLWSTYPPISLAFDITQKFFDINGQGWPGIQKFEKSGKCRISGFPDPDFYLDPEIREKYFQFKKKFQLWTTFVKSDFF